MKTPTAPLNDEDTLSSCISFDGDINLIIGEDFDMLEAHYKKCLIPAVINPQV